MRTVAWAVLGLFLLSLALVAFVFAIQGDMTGILAGVGLLIATWAAFHNIICTCPGVGERAVPARNSVAGVAR